MVNKINLRLTADKQQGTWKVDTRDAHCRELGVGNNSSEILQCDSENKVTSVFLRVSSVLTGNH
jgi:hypothetical protein